MVELNITINFLAFAIGILQLLFFVEGNVHHKTSAKLAQAIVDKHNQFRRSVSPSATNMKQISWDYGLQDVATKYSQNCIYEHNPDAKDKVFGKTGENLWLRGGVTITDDVITSAVTEWNSEDAFYDYDKMECEAGKMCGHYTQNVWANTYKVGCGYTTCDSIMLGGQEKKDATLVVCNYGPPGNWVGEKPYKKGGWCNGCAARDECTDKLCSDVNRDKISGSVSFHKSSYNFMLLLILLTNVAMHLL